MNPTIIRSAIALSMLFFGSVAHSATDWSTQDYDVYPGDFDGDGKTDLLYVAKDASKPSGIARSDGTAPNEAWQSWPSNHLGIQWYGGMYVPVIGDYNNDNKDDILMQRTSAGDSYLLLADGSGRITGVSQTIANSHLALTWSKDQHNILAGDFNGDGRADLFFQATVASGTHAVVFANASGTFTTGPTQTWTDGTWSAFKWSARHSVISVGDFNGDTRADLLIQRKPDIVLIDYDISIPVPVYPPNSFGVVLAESGATPFQQVGVQQWSRNALGVDWAAPAVIGDFNGDNRVDVLLQARHGGASSYLLTGNSLGSIFSSSGAVSVNVPSSSDSARLIAGNFDGTGGAGLYIQALSPSGTNAYANSVSTSISASTHNPASVTSTAPVSAVGSTPGAFAVDRNGAATYRIPIEVPPGINGVQPKLALTYSSHRENGLLGVGWDLNGLSQIVLCNATVDQDGFSVPLYRLCLDGVKLRQTNASSLGTYPYLRDGATYDTQNQSFSRIVKHGDGYEGVSFTMHGKDGLVYEYGGTGDSRIERVGGMGLPYAWLLNRVSDRAGNVMKFTYLEDGAPNGSYRPNEIVYTENSPAGVTAAYKVKFFWEERPASDHISNYTVGQLVRETKRLDKIETYYNGNVVKKYDVGYQQSATSRSRLTALQECAGSGECLAPTVFTWQDGTTSWSSEQTISTTGLDVQAAMNARAIDIDGDGRTDLVYPKFTNPGRYWSIEKSNGSSLVPFAHPNSIAGTFGVALPRSVSGGAVGLLLDSGGVMSADSVLSGVSGPVTSAYWAGDVDADDDMDIVYATNNVSGGYTQFSVRRMGPTGAFESPSSLATATGLNFTNPDLSSAMRPADFNGDRKTDFIAQSVRQVCEWVDEETGVMCFDDHTRVALVSGDAGYQAIELVHALCGSFPGAASCTDRMPIFAADFNGDRLTDIVYHDQMTDEWWLSLGTTAGLTTPQLVTLPAMSETGALAVDLSNDGRAELLYSAGGTWHVLRSTGTSFEEITVDLLPSGATHPRIMDVNGDGMTDFGYFRDGAYRVRLRAGATPDLLSTATDGVGNQASVTYAGVFDSSVYVTGSAPFSAIGLGGANIEIQSAPARMVVKEHRMTDGIGGHYTVSQKYIGARKHMGSQGFLGFEQREEKDNRTGITRHVNYVHEEPVFETPTMLFPYTGRPIRIWATQQGGAMIQESLFDYVIRAEGEGEPPLVYSCNEGGGPCGTGFDAIGGGASYRAFMYVEETIQRTHEVFVGDTRNGRLLTETTATVNEMDAYGNATDVTTVIEDQDTALPTNQRTFTTRVVESINNDSTHWCLGKSDLTTTTSTLGDGTSRVQRTARTIDDQKCRVTDEISAAASNGDPTALSVVTHYEFATAACGNPSSVSHTGRRHNNTTLPARTTILEYGAACVAPTKIKDPYLAETNRTYDYRFGAIDTETDPNGLTVNLDYDAFGRRTKITRPDNTSTTTELKACDASNGYCNVSDLRMRADTVERDTSGMPISTSHSYFDGLGRVRVTSNPLPLTGELSHVVSTYDALGRLATRSVPYTNGVPGRTVYEYDLINRARAAKLYDGAGTLIRQNKLRYEGRTTIATDPRNYETEKVFDALGQIRKVKDPTSVLFTTYGYTFSGTDLISTVTDKASNSLVTRTNLVGFKTQTQDPDMGSWTFEYNTFGELTKQTDAKFQVVSFEDYDLLGRPTVRHDVEGDTNFEYGTAGQYAYGQLRSISSNGYSELYTNDTFGRVAGTQITIPDDAVYTLSYSYDTSTGLLDTMTYPASTGAHPLKLKYGYAQGVQTTVRDYTNNTLGATYWQMSEMDAMGNATREQLDNDVKIITAYDATTGLMSSRQAGTDSAGSNRQNLAYQWDASGNLQRRTDHNQAGLYEHFYYDEINRLDYSTRNGTTNLNVDYNEIGNITSKSDVGAYDYTSPQVGCTYQAYSQPHAVRNAGAGSYCYDANGNMTSRPGASVTWYSDNSVKKITQGSITSEFWYSPNGDRFKQYAVFPSGNETTYYVGGVMEKVVVATGTAYRHYIAAGSSMAIHTRWSTGSNQTFYVTTDHLGSSTSVTDENGSVVVSESFDAFGKRRGTDWTGAPTVPQMQAINNVTRRGYTGHEHLDNLNLIHMNGRVQDPTLGRFMSADPLIQAPEFSQSLNRYSYVWNNPLTMTDPSGYDTGCGEKGSTMQISLFGEGCVEVVTVLGEQCNAYCRELTAQYAEEHLRMEQEMREQFFVDLAMNAKAELWDKPLDNAKETWSDVRQGNVTEAALGGLGIACDTVKLCRGLEKFAERVLGPVGRKAIDVFKKTGCQCFVAGTLVVGNLGAQPIETLRIGDIVLARDEVTGETAYKPITDIYVNDEGSVWELTILDANGQTDVHEVTGNHPYWTADQAWVAVEDLVVGSNLTTETGIAATLISKRDTGVIERTYNLEVADFHTYFVGPQRVLVHNGKNCTPHTVSGSRPPGGGKNGDPNSIWEQRRADGSKSVTYFDEQGRRFSREDYGQKAPHGNLGTDSTGRTSPHEHRYNYSEQGPINGQYRELDQNGMPVGPWMDE